MLQAQEYWRLKGLRADVVILNEHPVSYLDEMHDQLTALLDNGPWRAWSHQPGGVYLLRGDRMARPSAMLLAAVARAVLSGDRGDLAAQLEHAHAALARVRARRARRRSRTTPQPPPTELTEVPPLALANGLGGFADDGREYVIVLDGDSETPLPWANVIANPGFGTMVTASGAAFTWAGNSRENRLTPFANDPVTRPDLRGDLHPRRRDGRGLVATPGPLRPTPREPTSSCATAGVTRFTRARARASATSSTSSWTRTIR